MELPGVQQLLASAIHFLIEGQQEDAARPQDFLFMGARAWSTLARAVIDSLRCVRGWLASMLAVLRFCFKP